MRASVLQRPRAITLAHVPAPEPGPGEVLVRLSGSGVCGSNLPVWEGRSWFTYPLSPGSPGHEGWGHVEALGEGVTGLMIGTPVAVLSQRAFAEFDIANCGQTVAIPPRVAERPFPGEAVACGVNVINRAVVLPGQRVAVVGVGFLGAVVTRLAHLAGARVTAIARRPFAREMAAALGAADQVPLRSVAETVADAKAANGEQEFDTVIEVTGLQGPLDIASQLTGVRGKLVIAGYHQDGLRQVDLQLWNWRGLDVINAHERDPRVYVEGMREAVRLVEDGRLPLERLITHVFPMREANRAFECATERPEGFLKAVVMTHD